MSTVETKAQFTRAYSDLSDAIFRYFLFRVRDRDVAKELTQETFMRVWAYLAKGKRIEHFKAFCYTTSHHLFANYCKKQKPQSLDTLIEDGVSLPDSRAPSADTIEQSMTLMKEIEGLSDKYKEIVRLRYLDGLGPNEIAVAMGLSPNVISVRLHRALKQLRSLLTD